MILHLSQIFLTDALTFIACPYLLSALFEPVNDSSARQIVGRKLDQDFVTGQNLDEVLSHAARDVRQYLMLALQLDFEHRIGQGFQHRGLHLYGIFL